MMTLQVSRAKVEAWNEPYRKNKTPWDVGNPDDEVVKLVENRIVEPCRALDIGCGTGNEVIYLAKKGFEVTGIDISSIAVKRARRKAASENVRCDFRVADACDMSFLDGKFDFITDRGCFHFIHPFDREKYVMNVRKLISDNGKFLLIVSSDHDLNTTGPYRFSKDDIVRVFGREFRINSVRLTILRQHKFKPKPYVCLMEPSPS